MEGAAACKSSSSATSWLKTMLRTKLIVEVAVDASILLASSQCSEDFGLTEVDDVHGVVVDS